MDRFHSIVGALTTSVSPGAEHDLRPRPFITISRQAGAGGHTLQEVLVERLSELDPGEPAWTGIDKKLVEMVAGEDAVFKQLVESLGESTHSWLEELFAGLFSASNATEIKAYRRTAKAIRALAQRGRVIVVGRGGVFITHDMPLSVHVHLVAPLADRVEHMARRLGVARDEAEAHVHRIDQNRDAFFKRYWPNDVLDASSFTVTFNTTRATDREIADAVATLIPSLDARLLPPEKPATGFALRRGVFHRVAAKT